MWKLNTSMISRVKKHFINRGGETNNSKIFGNFSSNIQEEILSELKDSTIDEIPIIASYLKDEYFLVLTDSSLYFSDQTKINKKSLIELKDAGIEFTLHGKFKSEINKLKVTTTSNERFYVSLESGKPLSGFMNVIMLVGGLNKN